MDSFWKSSSNNVVVNILPLNSFTALYELRMRRIQVRQFRAVVTAFSVSSTGKEMWLFNFVLLPKIYLAFLAHWFHSENSGKFRVEPIFETFSSCEKDLYGSSGESFFGLFEGSISCRIVYRWNNFKFCFY